MSLTEPQTIYAFHTKDFSYTDSIRKYVDRVVKDIQSAAGLNSDVHVNIESEAKDKHLFSVSMGVYGLHEPVVVKKDGKQVMAVLRKVRKAILRQIHKLNDRRVSARRRHAVSY